MWSLGGVARAVACRCRDRCDAPQPFTMPQSWRCQSDVLVQYIWDRAVKWATYQRRFKTPGRISGWKFKWWCFSSLSHDLVGGLMDLTDRRFASTSWKSPVELSNRSLKHQNRSIQRWHNRVASLARWTTGIQAQVLEWPAA